MTVDLIRLAQCLAQIEAEPDSDIVLRDINPYLLEYVILPFLNGKDVNMGTLDYSEFTSDDIIGAFDEIDAVSNGAARVYAVSKLFKKAPPVARQTKAFC